MLDVSVNDTCDETTDGFDETDAVADNATVVIDAEGSLVEAFTDEDRKHQLDLCRVGKTTSYKLRKERDSKPVIAGVRVLWNTHATTPRRDVSLTIDVPTCRTDDSLLFPGRLDEDAVPTRPDRLRLAPRVQHPRERLRRPRTRRAR